jgi:hypothetical protein
MLFTFVMAGWALAAAEPAVLAPSNAPSKPNKDRLVCRETERTGSRLGTTRVCKRESEWKKYSEDIQERMDESVRDKMRMDPQQ